ncbi:uncharacterized protein HMPREF1541_07344 [Cyphellophora europaea CBS 101466]|uniref:NAD(P)-binding domain-containing protein n=1 Tax=Cyphellophora europaea (strain CBS 101466) TaxID=1220924 RepID=W2RMH4_CYPE1|nr:uncharacterized protein HMPREF1541_07344 [Cyphellophora europaea CBS 101466]ETN37721.1 hypothetical protein HMPREF1541_07344 [Cyphellophora europaea CBS 101466]
MTTTPPSLFLGATGGCANACLVHALRASQPCIALARTPSKLTAQLESQGLTPSQLANLTCVQGNALSLTDVKAALLAHCSEKLPGMIVTGLGGTPHLRFDWRAPLQIAGLDDAHVCEGAARTLVAALREVQEEEERKKKGKKGNAVEKPSVVFISTTGVSRGPEDVPLAMRFLYHQMLAVPHADKKGMEDVLRAEEGGVFRKVSGVRPTLLAGAVSVEDGVGWKALRAGTEQKPELGYSVKRADVGEWIYENLVKEGGERRRWEGEMVSLTS